MFGVILGLITAIFRRASFVGITVAGAALSNCIIIECSAFPIIDATRLLILRPLVGANKDEIIQLAHRIGTGPISATVAEYCALVPRRPAPAANLAAVEEEEARLDATLLEPAVASRKIIDVRDADPDASAMPELTVEAVPAGRRGDRPENARRVRGVESARLGAARFRARSGGDALRPCPTKTSETSFYNCILQFQRSSLK